MTGLHLFDKHLLNANCGLVLGHVDRLISKWSQPFEWSLLYRELQKQEGRRVGLRTESVFKDKLINKVGRKEGKRVWKVDLSEKANHLIQGMGTEKARGFEEL